MGALLLTVEIIALERGSLGPSCQGGTDTHEVPEAETGRLWVPASLDCVIRPRL